MKMFEDPPAAISHDAHPAHKLKLVTVTDGGPPFRCDGCKEPGSGKGRRYRCDDDGCEFDLHTCCALAEPALKHPLLGDLEFKLLPEAATAAAEAAAVCSACGETARGLVYRCGSNSKKGGHYLHPCCAALRMETVLEDEHQVQLCGEAKLRCAVCGEKGHRTFWSKKKLWAYRWRYGGAEGYLHVACVKRIAVQSWEQAYLQEGGVLEASVPIMKGVLQRRSPGDNNETVKSSGLELAIGSGVEVAGTIADVVASSSSSQ